MVLDYLHAGQVDIAFASEPKDKDAYSVRHCFDTHQLFVAAPNYDCDFDHVHSMEEIASFPLILLERKASSRVYVEQFFQQHGVSIKPEIELGSHNLLISLARIGPWRCLRNRGIFAVRPWQGRHPAAAHRF